MKEELFQQLAASLKEGGAILRGKKKPRSTTLKWPDAKAVGDKLGLSQNQFAALIGISVRTLQIWEQGHRRPEGTHGRCCGLPSFIPKRCWRRCTGERVKIGK